MIINLFKLDDSKLKVKINEVNKIKPYLNEDNEIILNCVFKMTLENVNLEFMKEIIVDFTNVNFESHVIKIANLKSSIQLHRRRVLIPKEIIRRIWFTWFKVYLICLFDVLHGKTRL